MISVTLINGGVMRGGRREGSGRKPGEKSVVRRVPVGCLSAVDALIVAYRENVTKIKEATSGFLEPVTEIKDASLDRQKQVTEIKQVHVASIQQSLEHSQALDDLQRLPNSVQKQLRKTYGTLRAAVLAGVRRQGKAAVMLDIAAS